MASEFETDLLALTTQKQNSFSSLKPVTNHSESLHRRTASQVYIKFSPAFIVFIFILFE